MVLGGTTLTGMSDVGNDRTGTDMDAPDRPRAAQRNGEVTLLLLVAVVFVVSGVVGLATGNGAQSALFPVGVVFFVLAQKRRGGAGRGQGGDGGSAGATGAGHDRGWGSHDGSGADSSGDGGSDGGGGGGAD